MIAVFDKICQGFIKDWFKVINPEFIRDGLGNFWAAKLGKLEEIKLCNFFGRYKV